MQGIIFAPKYNRSSHVGTCTSTACTVPAKPQNDATGAFQPGAKVFREVHALPEPVLFDNHLPDEKCRETIEHKIMTASGSLGLV
jgi:hypothetical protein